MSIRGWVDDFRDAPDDYWFLLPLWIAAGAGLAVLYVLAAITLPFRLVCKLVKRAVVEQQP